MAYTFKKLKDINQDVQNAFVQVLDNHGLKYSIKSNSRYEENEESYDDNEVIIDFYNEEVSFNITDMNDDFLCCGWYNVMMDDGQLYIKDFYVSGRVNLFGETQHEGIFCELHDTFEELRKKYNAKEYLPINWERKIY